jgi:hypothetical protein
LLAATLVVDAASAAAHADLAAMRIRMHALAATQRLVVGGNDNDESSQDDEDDEEVDVDGDGKM